MAQLELVFCILNFKRFSSKTDKKLHVVRVFLEETCFSVLFVISSEMPHIFMELPGNHMTLGKLQHVPLTWALRLPQKLESTLLHIHFLALVNALRSSNYKLIIPGLSAYSLPTDC